jgi:hypothetical protein
MRTLIKIFYEVALCLGMLVIIYFWLGFIIINVWSDITKG